MLMGMTTHQDKQNLTSYELWKQSKTSEVHNFSNSRNQRENYTTIQTQVTAGVLLNNLKQKNKGVPFDQWKKNKTLELQKYITFVTKLNSAILSVDNELKIANKEAVSKWLREKNIEAEKRNQALKNHQVQQHIAEEGFTKLKEKTSKKAFKAWLQTKYKEIEEKKRKRLLEEYSSEMLISKVKEYNKKARKEWLRKVMSRNSQRSFLA